VRNINLKSLLEVLSAVAVLLGLAFVGFELRQNTAAVEASSRQSTTDAAVAWLLTIASEPELAHLWGVASKEPQNLSETEAIQLHLLLRSQWIRFQNAYLQWKNGTLSDDDWNIYEGFICRTRMRAQVNEDSASLRVATWDNHKAVLHSQFVDFVESCRDELLEDID
jgi:hypothetical protein